MVVCYQIHRLSKLVINQSAYPTLALESKTWYLMLQDQANKHLQNKNKRQRVPRTLCLNLQHPSSHLMNYVILKLNYHKLQQPKSPGKWLHKQKHKKIETLMPQTDWDQNLQLSKPKHLGTNQQTYYLNLVSNHLGIQLPIKVVLQPMISQKWESRLSGREMVNSACSINGLLLAGRPTLTVRIPRKFSIQRERQLVPVQNNSELETTRCPSVGIWQFNKCLKARLQRFYAQLILIKEEA